MSDGLVSQHLVFDKNKIQVSEAEGNSFDGDEVVSTL